MIIKYSWKRVIAGTLAVLVVAGTVPANTDFGGFFGGTSITASAATGKSGGSLNSISVGDYFISGASFYA